MITYSTYLAKHKSQLRGPVTKTIKLARKKHAIDFEDYLKGRSFMYVPEEIQQQMSGWALCLQRFPQHPRHIENNDMSILTLFIVIKTGM
jgi:hypothetical protein